ncbi:MAG: hypothetical protein TREMPRED_004877 [Tremellales sp. Tagirdzhanova-0007]|nr:MAG: hypothetical protein TREMPRED_004877 [Tremellales sp. Tagirdzhanova-0007]
MGDESNAICIGMLLVTKAPVCILLAALIYSSVEERVRAVDCGGPVGTLSLALESLVALAGSGFEKFMVSRFGTYIGISSLVHDLPMTLSHSGVGKRAMLGSLGPRVRTLPPVYLSLSLLRGPGVAKRAISNVGTEDRGTGGGI